jgi:hypothetical protein
VTVLVEGVVEGSARQHTFETPIWLAPDGEDTDVLLVQLPGIPPFHLREDRVVPPLHFSFGVSQQEQPW